MDFIIREQLPSELENVLMVERAAFGSDEVANLVRDLLDDPSAVPRVSLLAFDEDRAVGHVLFTRAHLTPMSPLTISILAPLAVVPTYQRRGVGSNLVVSGLQRLKDAGVDLVFVLGHPEYYPRFGFEPALRLGFQATYPIPAKNESAWMVLALRPGLLGNHQGTVICAEAMNRPEHWRE